MPADPATFRQVAEQLSLEAIGALSAHYRYEASQYVFWKAKQRAEHTADLLDAYADRLTRDAQASEPEAAQDEAYRQGRDDARCQEPSREYELACLMADREALTRQLAQATARWQALTQFISRQSRKLSAADVLDRVQAEMTRLTPPETPIE